MSKEKPWLDEPGEMMPLPQESPHTQSVEEKPWLSDPGEVIPEPQHQPVSPKGEFAPVVSPLYPIDFLKVLAAQSSFNPEEQAAIYRNVFQNAEFGQDQEGRPLIKPLGQDWQYINAPGLSASDIVAGGINAGAGVLGGLATGGTGAMSAPTILGMAARNAAIEGITQAGLETGQLAAGGEFNPSEVALATGGGFGGSALGQGLAVGAAKTSSKISQIADTGRRAARDTKGMLDRVRKYLDEESAIARAYGPEAIKAEGMAKEFGIPYTLGQTTGSKVQQQIEENIIKGGSTEAAQRKIGKFVAERQIPAERTAVQATQEELAKGSRVIETPEEGSAQLIGSIHQAADNLWSRISEAYSKVGKAEVDPETAAGIYRRIKRVAAAEGMETAPEIAPYTSRALKIINDASKELNPIVDEFGEVISEPGPVTLRRLNRYRKRLLRLKNDATTPTDRRQVGALLAAFDDRLDRASMKGLFSGDLDALKALREANSLRRKYGELFGPSTTMRRSGRKVQDQAGKFIEDLAEGNPNPHETINAIFGAHSLYRRGGPEIVDRIKKLHSAGMIKDHDLNAIRQAAFMRLFKDTGKEARPSARKFLSNLHSPGNRQILTKLFSGEELAKMDRLGKALLKSQPEINNPSGTAAAISQILNRTNAFKSGGLVGFTLSEFADFFANRKAAKAISKIRPFAGTARAASTAGRTGALAIEHATDESNQQQR